VLIEANFELDTWSKFWKFEANFAKFNMLLNLQFKYKALFIWTRYHSRIIHDAFSFQPIRIFNARCKITFSPFCNGQKI